MKRSTLLRTAAIVLALFAGACGDREASPAGNGTARDAPRAANRVIEVRMVTDEKGNYFDPEEITAKPGDVLRFRLVTGVHNVSFSAAGDRAGTNLPQPSGLLDSAGQTLDVPVRLAPGEYAFRCDPHLPFDMVGKLTVE
jgi:plastocyanin